MLLSWKGAQSPVESEVKRQGRAPVCVVAEGSVCLGLYQHTQIVDFTSGCLSPLCRLCLLLFSGRADKSPGIWSRLALGPCLGLAGAGDGALWVPSWVRAETCGAGLGDVQRSRGTLVCKYLLSQTRSTARNRSQSTHKHPALAALRLVGSSNAQFCLY